MSVHIIIGESFGGNFSASGSYYGDVVFAGLGISDPDKGWDDLKDLDVKGKVVLILDALRPGYKYAPGRLLFQQIEYNYFSPA